MRNHPLQKLLFALTGRLDALNVFDGSRSGLYEENYYKYLNIGLRLPISTGTDWFLFDQSRVYAEVRGPLTIPSWLDAVKAGRCQATNGPLLSLKVDGQTPGAVIDLQKPKTVTIEASAVGRVPLHKLELIHNGRVLKTQLANPKDPGRIRFTTDVRLDEPAWFALRSDSPTKNEFDKTIFAHTSPVYVTRQGRGVFVVDDALGLVKHLEEGQAAIKLQARFSTPEAERTLLATYDDAIAILRTRLNKRE